LTCLKVGNGIAAQHGPVSDAEEANVAAAIEINIAKWIK
jgi:hypothetical protein